MIDLICARLYELEIHEFIGKLSPQLDDLFHPPSFQQDNNPKESTRE